MQKIKQCSYHLSSNTGILRLRNLVFKFITQTSHKQRLYENFKLQELNLNQCSSGIVFLKSSYSSLEPSSLENILAQIIQCPVTTILFCFDHHPNIDYLILNLPRCLCAWWKLIMLLLKCNLILHSILPSRNSLVKKCLKISKIYNNRPIIQCRCYSIIYC